MENKIYTKAQLKALEDLDVIKYFDTVLDSNYKRGTSNELNNKVADIYDEATGEKINRNFNCKICCYNLYRTAGTLYRKSKAHYKSQQVIKMQKAREAKNNKDKKDNNGTTEP